VKILLLDIETYPHIAYVWGLFKQNIPISHIAEPGRTACWAAKWYGEEEVFFGAEWEDEDFIGKIWDLLYEADVVVHYNGSRFDIPTLNREFILAGGQPPAPYHEIDLLRPARKHFRFPSNKLDYISQELGIGQKIAHRGMDLWTGCMHNDKECQVEMEEYNRQDVVLLEPLYEKLLPWIDNHPHVGLYTDSDEEIVCRNCGSSDLQKRGFQTTRLLKYQRYRCNNCGKWNRTKTSVETTVTR